MIDSLCPICKNAFNMLERLPRLFGSCGHTFCTNCIITIIKKTSKKIICPLDKKNFDFYSKKKGIRSFPINLTLEKVLRKRENINFSERMKNLQKMTKKIKSSQKKLYFCCEHEKNFDLICLEDRKLICEDCFLFGKCNNHEIMKVKKFLEKIRMRLQNFESKKRIFDLDIKSLICYENIKNKVETKKKILLEKEEKIFSKIKTEIDLKEKEINLLLREKMLKFKKTINFINNNGEKLRLINNEINSQIKNLKNHLLQKKPNNNIFLENLFLKNGLFKVQSDLVKEYENFNNLSKKLITDYLKKMIFKENCFFFFEILKKKIFLKKKEKKNKRDYKRTKSFIDNNYKKNSFLENEKFGIKKKIRNKSFLTHDKNFLLEKKNFENEKKKILKLKNFQMKKYFLKKKNF